MSAIDVAVRAFRKLEPEDFRVLSVIEVNMSRYRYVPEDDVFRFTGFPLREIRYRLSRLDSFGLIYRWVGPYVGYTLNTAGYDCLAINALVKADILEALGKPLGIGKESDVYDALTPEGERVAVKFHRLGRISFRQTRRLRSYVADGRRVSWLYQAHLAAESEFKALKIVFHHGVSVPKPIYRNRHVVVMGMIEGAELAEFIDLPNPEEVLDEILFNIKEAYVKAEIIHGDLSEYNLIIKPDLHILIIDWPQFVRKEHPSAEYLLKRDVLNLLKFFSRKFKVERDLEKVLTYVKRSNLSSSSATS